MVCFADFVIVQSAWGMTQGFVMPLSGFLITAIGEKVVIHIISIIITIIITAIGEKVVIQPMSINQTYNPRFPTILLHGSRNV